MHTSPVPDQEPQHADIPDPEADEQESTGAAVLYHPGQEYLRPNTSEEEAVASTANLGAREAAVLTELARDPDSRVAFQGLRRRLGIHQESLSRTLRRLEADGLLLKESGGYRLTPLGASLLPPGVVGLASIPTQPVVQVQLPAHLSPESVAQGFTHRWFRGIRWYGRSDGPDGTLLTWLTEPGNRPVRIRIRESSLTLEHEEEPDDPGAVAILHDATRSLLGVIAELYSGAARPRVEPDARPPSVMGYAS